MKIKRHWNSHVSHGWVIVNGAELDALEEIASEPAVAANLFLTEEERHMLANICAFYCMLSPEGVLPAQRELAMRLRYATS